MKFMRRRVEITARPRNRSAIAATVIGALLMSAALPLCAQAIVCTMPCCDGSHGPMGDHGATPASPCGGSGTDCLVATPLLLSAEAEVTVPPDSGPPREAADSTDTAGAPVTLHAQVVEERAHTRHLYVLNDVFLI